MKHVPLCSEPFRTIRQLGICQVLPTARGCRAGTKLRRPIVVRITPGIRAAMCKQHQEPIMKCQNQLSGSGLHINRSNLINIQCDSVSRTSARTSANKCLQVCCLNPRSIKNKTLSISDYIISHDYDVVAFTETWLGTSVDKKCIGELVPSGYKFKHVPRPGRRRGGGVALLYKSAITVQVHGSSTSSDYTHFEHMDCNLSVDDTTVRLAVVYRPQPSKENGLKNSVFFEEWSAFLSKYVTHSEEILIVGDLNFHVDIKNDHDAEHFIDTLKACGLQQHVHEPTHVLGHTLDLVINRDTSQTVSNIVVSDPALVDHAGKLTRDHFAVGFMTTLTKPAPIQKTISFRKLQAIDIEAFKQDIMISPSLCSTSGTVEDLVQAYSEGLSLLIDKHAPIRTKTITQRPNCPWYSDELHEAKHLRRKLERRWRKSRLTVDHQIYRDQCIVMNKLLKRTRQTYYSDKIIECGRDQKGIFKVAKHLLGDTGCPSLPSTAPPSELTEIFSNFFTEKILTIRRGLQSDEEPEPEDNESHINMQPFVKKPLKQFTCASQKEVKTIIMKSPNKSCELDPVPTWLLKSCVDELLPIITAIINTSLKNSHVPRAFKCARIRPLLKKSGLDPDILKNYRPVSNLPFISKVLEKAVDAQLEHHLVTNELHEGFQSAYRRSHSTETALLKVQNDILEALDKGLVTVLIMLDLSAAFDTIDHQTLLDRFEHLFGVTGQALEWISSYLRDRYQVVAIDDELSQPVLLQHGVPQGSVLGPKKYTMYTKPLGDLIQHHGLKYHFYADDTQLYVSFKPNNDAGKHEALGLIEKCLTDIESWMHKNMLKLNTDKTEVMLFLSKHNAKLMKDVSVKVGDCLITSTSSVKNLGVIFDSCMSMEQQVNSVSRSGYYQLRNIGHIRRYLTNNATKSLVNGLVTSRLDYCNVLLCGMPQTTLNKLQQVQNRAARIVTRTSRNSHVTPVLKELHWLPIKYRVQFKILMHTYKALHGLAPKYISDMLNVYQPKRALRSMDTCTLVVPKVRTVTYGDRQYKTMAPKLWNALPVRIRQAGTLETFKSQLKTHFFTLHFGT